MIVALVLASYKSGGVLFQRYYGSSLASEEAQARMLLNMRDVTAFEWPSLVDDQPEQCAFMDGMHVMYKLIGDVVITLVGTDDHDQLLLLEFSRAFEVAIRRLLRVKKDVSMESKMLQSYSKVCMVVEEMILDGEIDQLDVGMIEGLIAMK